MPLHLDVVCDPLLPPRVRQQQTVQVLGEILPYVLAKYGVGTKPDRRTQVSQSLDHRSKPTKPK